MKLNHTGWLALKLHSTIFIEIFLTRYSRNCLTSGGSCGYSGAESSNLNSPSIELTEVAGFGTGVEAHTESSIFTGPSPAFQIHGLDKVCRL